MMAMAQEPSAFRHASYKSLMSGCAPAARSADNEGKLPELMAQRKGVLLARSTSLGYSPGYPKGSHPNKSKARVAGARATDAQLQCKAENRAFLQGRRASDGQPASMANAVSILPSANALANCSPRWRMKMLSWLMHSNKAGLAMSKARRCKGLFFREDDPLVALLRCDFFLFSAIVSPRQSLARRWGGVNEDMVFNWM